MKLSATQIKALKKVVADFDAHDATERRCWGKPFTGWVDMTGSLARTLHRLADLGLIEFKGIGHTYSVLRCGRFGRGKMRMGTKGITERMVRYGFGGDYHARRFQVPFVQITEAGRKAI